VSFYGAEGEVLVNRGKFIFKRGNETIAAIPKSRNKKGKRNTAEENYFLRGARQKAERAFLQSPKVQLYNSKNHQADFLGCVKTRKKPITNEQVGGVSAIVAT